MAEEKTVTTTAAETGEKPKAAEGTVQEKPEAAARTYNQAYVDDLIERQKAAQEAAVAEALKVAGMDKDAKEKYEQEQAEEKMAKREADIARRELKADAREVLAEKQIPTEFLDMLLGSDLKETKANADAFKTKFDAAVQAQVEKRLAGKTPQGGNGSQSGTSMKSEIEKYMA